MNHVINKDNRPADKGKGKAPPPYQNPTNPKKSKTSVFIVGDSMIKKVDGYLLTSSLKDQHLMKARPFSTAKTIDMYDYVISTQRDLKPETSVFQVGTNDLPFK